MYSPSGADGEDANKPKGETVKTGGANKETGTAFEASYKGDIPEICGNCNETGGATTSSTTGQSNKQDVGTMTTSQAGVDFIKSFEGLETKLYNDDAGYATIGYGHLVHYGKVGTNDAAEEPFKNGITKSQAENLLKNDIKNKAEKYVKSYVNVQLTQNQFDALVSFTFNVGAGNFKSSTVLKKVNANEVDSQVMKKWFTAWNKSGGKVSNGLTKRREAESNIYNNGKYVNNQ